MMWDILSFSSHVPVESVPEIYKLINRPGVTELNFMVMTDDGEQEAASLDLTAPGSIDELKWALVAAAAGQGIGYSH